MPSGLEENDRGREAIPLILMITISFSLLSLLNTLVV